MSLVWFFPVFIVSKKMIITIDENQRIGKVKNCLLLTSLGCFKMTKESQKSKHCTFLNIFWLIQKCNIIIWSHHLSELLCNYPTFASLKSEFMNVSELNSNRKEASQNSIIIKMWQSCVKFHYGDKNKLHFK